MKIGLVSRFPPERCGIAIYSENLAKNLDCQVIKIGTKESDANYKIDLRSFMLKEKIKEIIEKEKLDLIHFQYIAASEFYGGTKTLNINFIRALKQDVPAIVTLHEVQQDKKGARNFILSLLQEQIVKGSDCVICHTPGQKRFLDESYGAKNVECVYMGVELKKENKRKNKNLLFFGMINNGKGVEYLTKAMDLLKDYRLFIAGTVINEEYKKKLLDLIKNNKNKNIKYEFGWISEESKEEYFRNASMVIFPYVWAPYQSAVISDAVSYGLPVVVTRRGAIWEIVESFGFGEVCEPENPKAISDAIKKISGEYMKYKKGITKYREVSKWSVVAEEHKKVYESSLGRDKK